jgi:hypothetical protein
MRKLLFVLASMLCFHVTKAQFIYKIKADSVLITNDSCTAELNLENSTKNVPGSFLYNKGNGRTAFRKVLTKIDNSTYLIGLDTIFTGGGNAGNAWLLTGNAGINPSTNFLGTTDNNTLAFRSNNIERGSLSGVGDWRFNSPNTLGNGFFVETAYSLFASNQPANMNAGATVNIQADIANEGYGQLILSGRNGIEQQKRFKAGYNTSANYAYITATDLNTGLGRPLVLQNDGGNVGIGTGGTTFPDFRLTVNGGGAFGNSSNGYVIINPLNLSRAGDRIRVGQSLNTGDGQNSLIATSSDNGGTWKNVLVERDGYVGLGVGNGPSWNVGNPAFRVHGDGRASVSTSQFIYGNFGGPANSSGLITYVSNVNEFTEGASYPNSANFYYFGTWLQSPVPGTYKRAPLRISAKEIQFFNGGLHTVETESGRFTESGNLLLGGTTDAGYKLDVNGTARVQNLPFIASRDTVVTYDPATKQLAVTKITTGGAGTYILNQLTQQPGSNFNISGSGTIGNGLTVTGNIVQPAGTASFGNGIILDMVGADRRIFGSGKIIYQSNGTGDQHEFANAIGTSFTGTLVTINPGPYPGLPDNQLALKVMGKNSANGLNVDMAGRVGINTTTPNSTVKLQVNGNISSPGVQLGSEKFGLSSVADSLYSTAIGFQSNAKSHATAVGAFAAATGNYSTALGQQTQATGDFSVAVGRASSATTTYGIAMGQAASSLHTGAIVIGANTSSTATNQVIIGSWQPGFDARDVIFGMGESSGFANVYGGVKIRATNGTGPDVAGANLRIAAGRGTGTGNGGTIGFFTSPAGAAGSTLNTENEAMRIIQNGNIGMGTPTPAYKLDINGTARVQTLPFIASRDTVVTYDPATKQLAVTKITAGGGGGPASVKITSDLPVSGSTTLGNANGLSFSVNANTYYHYKFVVVFRTAATTTGIRLSVTTPASPTVFSGKAQIPIAIDGAGGEWQGWITASDDAVIGTGVQAANTDYIAIVEGNILTGATAGTIQLRFASEVAGSNVTIRNGSFGQLTTY